jgi:hypothetical protein
MDNSQTNINQEGNTSNANDSKIQINGSDNKINISSLIQDNSGGLSTSRVILLVWSLGTFSIWAFAAIVATLHGLPFPPIPESVITILLGVMAGKVIQRPLEK